MKKLIALTVTLVFSQPVLAANINTLQNLAQGEFRGFSEDLGSALSYKGVVPAEPLGITGFDLGLEVTQTSLAKSKGLWSKVGTRNIDNLYVPKLHVTKGLPLNIDVGGFFSAIPSTGIKLYGGELRWAILPGSTTLPAIALRGSLTKLSGVNQLSFDTRGVDVSISKGFAMFTPFAGVGQVWTRSNPDASTTLSKETFSKNKYFVGANLNLGISNLAAEYDKTGSADSVSVKLGLRF
ncbi:hypothetical protein [Ferrigenium sp. UT5]|uniref:hypothetical protein n=1 Tax=Ferrigenium sp. UT5 TaxID=3242105 RepID=UPI00354E0FCA